jgi:GrpB-like predicted nucleotidyltransferase (UPF0157 family)
MSERRHVELVDHSAQWATHAHAEAARIAAALGPTLVAVHHVGSTAIPGIRAKPILDLVPEVTSLHALDRAAAQLTALGYLWQGEFGITGRRYCTLDDAATGVRRLQLHCFATRHPELRRMLEFRDYLRAHPDEASSYEREKERLRSLHPDDTLAYAAAKTPWIRALELRIRDSVGHVDDRSTTTPHP